MTDTEGMKIRFNKNVVFGWGQLITVGVFLFSVGGTYALIQQTASETREVSERQVARAALVDGKLEKIAENISDVKKDIAVSQANQVVISSQIKQLQDLLLTGRASPAVYKTGGGN